MERYTDRRKDKGGSLKYNIMDGNREEMRKIRLLPQRLSRRIGVSKTSGSEG